MPLMKFEQEKWYKFDIEINTQGLGRYSLAVNDKVLVKDCPNTMAVKSVERISFRTGAYRDLPNRKTPNEVSYPPLKGADEQQNLSSYYIDDVRVSSSKK